MNIFGTGFMPQYIFSDAIKEIKRILEDKIIVGSEEYNTVKWMKKLGLSDLKE